MYIASVSFGKDSLAMLLLIIEKKLPLDKVVFFDTGMEFNSIYNNRDKILELLKEKNIEYEELKPDYPFLYYMLEKKIKYRNKEGYHKGYQWCGGSCRWGTSLKLKAFEKYNNDTIYVGIAYDEKQRYYKLSTNKIAPLYDYKMTESDALKFCYAHGYNWNENGVELYDVLDRVSCWCCANKNLKELENMYKYLPEYFEKLKTLQLLCTRPFKKYHNKKYGVYGNVFQLEKIFQQNNESGD